MKLHTFDDFLKNFDLTYNPDFGQYKKDLYVFRRRQPRKLVSVYLEDKLDFRTDNYEKLIKIYFDVFIIRKEETLKLWYDQHIAVDRPDDYLFFTPKNIQVGNTISGRSQSHYTRIVKNLNFDSLYKTIKTNGLDSVEILPALQLMIQGPCIYYPFILPMGAIKFLQWKPGDDLKDIFAILRGTTNRPSVFNPYTAAYIFQHIFQAKKIFTPVIDWGSYYIAYKNVPNAEEYVGIDVMRSQIEVLDKLQYYYDEQRSFYDNSLLNETFLNEKSETIMKYPDWNASLKDRFDTVFFSPPYFDLELYDSRDQSTDSFPKYEDWLVGYWEETLKLCKHVMTPDGKFGFVITDSYGMEGDRRYIARDLLTIAEKYFNLKETYKIEWSAITRVSAKKMQNGNFEHFYLMEKK